MTKMHKKVLFIVLISSNLLLSPTSAFGLDKYHKKIFDGNYLYPASLLNSKVESLHLSSRRQWVELLFNCLKTRQCLPEIVLPGRKPPIHPPRKQIVSPPNLENFPIYRVDPTQFNKVVNDAMSKAKQKVYARKLLSNMSEINGLLLQKHLEDDITITARNQFAPITVVSDLRKEVQTLADQVYQDAGGLYYPAEDAASQVFASRYKMRNGVFTKQDMEDAQLAAQQAIQKRRQDKVRLVVSATTTITITGIAVDSAEERVKANGGRNSWNLQRRNNYPVNRFQRHSSISIENVL